MVFLFKAFTELSLSKFVRDFLFPCFDLTLIFKNKVFLLSILLLFGDLSSLLSMLFVSNIFLILFLFLSIKVCRFLAFIFFFGGALLYGLILFVFVLVNFLVCFLFLSLLSLIFVACDLFSLNLVSKYICLIHNI